MRRLIIGLLLVALALLFWGRPVPVHGQVSPSLLVEGEPFTGEGPPLWIEQEVFVPLRVLVTAFGAQLRWLTDEQGYQLNLADSEIRFRVNSRQITANDRPVTLRQAPRVVQGRTMVPMEMIAGYMPIITSWDPVSGRLDLRRPLNQLSLLCADLNSDGRPVVVLNSRDDLGIYRVVEELTREDRLVMDFFSIQAAAEFQAENRGNPLIRRLRWEALSANRIRLTIELNRGAAYRLVTYPGESRHLEIHFDYVLREIRYVEEEGWARVLFDTGGDVEYRVMTLKDPDRVVIDLPGTVNLVASPREAVDKPFLSAIRSSQFDARTARVVLDLPTARSVRVSRRPGVRGIIVVDFPRRITAAGWEDGQMVVRGEGDLSGKVSLEYGSAGTVLRWLIPNAVLSGSPKPTGGPAAVRETTIQATADGGLEIRMLLGQFGGYQIAPGPDSTRLILRQSVLAGRTIILDAGHGGQDSGAISPWGLREKDLNLDVTLRIARRLHQAGATVILIREDDLYISPYDRAAMANATNGEVFISIHGNAHPTDANVRGIETFHHPARTEARRLARLIQAEALRVTGLMDRGVKTNDKLIVTRECLMPAVLLEIGFLTNQAEETIIRTDAFRDAIADAVLEALFQFFSPGEIRASEP